MNILFEGLDLAGKSTVCRLLKQRLGESWQIRHNSIANSNPVYTLANELRLKNLYDDKTLGYLYYAALKFDLRLYEEESSAMHFNIIQDSTILIRSIAFHKALGNIDISNLFEQTIPEIPEFDHYFTCKVSHEERLRRLSLRRKENLASEDLLVSSDPDLFYAMESYLFEIMGNCFHAVEINTDGDIKNDKQRIETLLDEIISHLGGV